MTAPTINSVHLLSIRDRNWDEFRADTDFFSALAPLLKGEMGLRAGHPWRVRFRSMAWSIGGEDTDLLGPCWIGVRQDKPHFPLYLWNCWWAWSCWWSQWQVCGDSWSFQLQPRMSQTYQGNLGFDIGLALPPPCLPLGLGTQASKAISLFFLINNFQLGFYHFQPNRLSCRGQWVHKYLHTASSNPYEKEAVMTNFIL